MSDRYNFDKKGQFGHYEVQVDTAAGYGYFEHDIHGDARGGGLWFQINEGQRKLELVDFDGMAVLPSKVAKGLVEMGLYLDPELYADELGLSADQPHASDCANRLHSAAECTCGKADREAGLG